MTANDDTQSETDRQQTDEADRSTETRDYSVAANQKAEPTEAPDFLTRRGYLSAMTAVVTGAAVGSGRVAGEPSGHTQRPAVWDRPDWSPVTTGIDAVPGRFEKPRTVADQGTLAAPETLGELWSQEFQDQTVGVPFFAGPESDRVYAVGSNLTQQPFGQTIYALNKNTGDIDWDITLNTASLPPLGVNPGQTLYYVDTAASDIVAVNADNGSERWRESLGLATGLPTTFHLESDSTVYVLVGNEAIAYDDQDGTEQWRQSVSFEISPILNGVYDDGDTSLLHLANGQNVGLVVALDRDTGDVEWSEQRRNPVSYQLTVGDTAYAMFQEEFVALDPVSGEVQWVDERDDNLIWSFISPQSDSPLYALASLNPGDGSTEGDVVKFDTSGQRLWEFDPGAFPVGITVEGENVHVVTRDGEVIAINDDPGDSDYGTKVWSKSLDGGVRDAGLRRSGDVLYTGTVAEPGTVYALSATDGSTLDIFEMDSGVSGGLSVVDERIWIAERPPYDQTPGNGDSVLYELGSDDSGDEWYSDYTDGDGVVETSGLETAIDDLRADQLSVDRLKTLMDSWESGQPVST